jgi:serine phosphatase RsbU (regulator of sigma subunit)
MLLLGLAVTAAAALVSSVLYQRNEQHLLFLRAEDAGQIVAAAVPDVETPLASAAEIATVTDGSARKVAALLAQSVGRPGSGKPFVSATLWRVDGRHAVLVTGVGAPPDLRSSSRSADELLDAAMHSADLSVALVGPPSAPRLGYEYRAPRSPYAVFGEADLPPNRRSVIGTRSPFAAMDFALYLGRSAKPAALVDSNVTRLPLAGRTASVEVPFGASTFLLVIGAPKPLSSWFFENLRWMVAGGGSLLALLLALLVERLVRQRELATLGADRLRRLQGVAAALGTVGSPADVRAVAMRLAVPALGASAGSLALVDDGGATMTVVGSAGYGEEALAELRHVPLESATPLAEAARSGEMVLVPDLVAWLERAEAVGFVPSASAVALPLAVKGKRIGAIGLSFERHQDFDAPQVAFFEAMIGHIASALERARLLEEALSLLDERTTVAEGLQSSLLPPALPDLGRARLAVRYHPEGSAIQVGGDFYDAFPLGPRRWLLAVGDVEGRGVEAAAVTGLVRHSLRSLMLTGTTPSEALAHVNELLLAQWTGARGTPGGGRLCSVAAAVLEAGDERAVLRLALAGHPQPLLVAGDGSARPVGELGSVLGADGRAAFADCEIELAAGQAIVLYTDGVTERRHGGRFFGEEGIVAAVADVHPGDAEGLVRSIEQAVRDFAPGELTDDVVILVLSVPTLRAARDAGEPAGRTGAADEPATRTGAASF